MFRNGPRALELFPSGQKCGAVLQGPSKILHVRQFNSVSRKVLGQLNEIRNIRDIVPMEHDVHSQREFERFDPMHGLELPVEGWCSGDAV